MGEFYGQKIVSKEINPKTKKEWTLEDVPRLWREKTKNWITSTM